MDLLRNLLARRRLRALVLVVGLGILALAVHAVGASAPAESRQPAVAGQFYPGDRTTLAATIQSCLAQAKPRREATPLGLVAPHAGYVYCGRIMADAWRQAEGGNYDLIVILGTNHYVADFDKISVWNGGPWLTPLGAAPVDGATAAALLAADPDDCNADPLPHAREHSIEVQVPWAQTLFPRVPILPVVVGTDDLEACRRFGLALAHVIVHRRALIVASSDLSHYPPKSVAGPVDRATLAAIATLDGAALKKTIRAQMTAGTPGLVTCACGEAPILAMLSVTKVMGANKGTVVDYTNSGEVSAGDPTRVVGYGAVAITGGFCEAAPGPVQSTSAVHAPAPTAGPSAAKAETPQAKAPSPAASRFGTAEAAAAAPASGAISPADRTALLALARQSIRASFERGAAPSLADCGPALRVQRGAFVTLQKGGELRGCIGHMAEDSPLCNVVAEMAQAAAFHDYRFPPLRKEELDACRIEISVLTPAQPIGGPDEIVLGRDGVILAKDGRSAVFLPQVAPEQGWDVPTMLTELARKAGLPPDAWRSGASFRTFQAEVFGESGGR